jgi:IS30 family transposase
MISKTVRERKYSFDIIAGRMKLKNYTVSFCTQTLYNYYNIGLLKISNFHLPNFGQVKHSKRIRRANIAHESIENRPETINDRTEAMHWEMDCVVSGLTKGPVLLVLSERLTRTELIFKMQDKTAANLVSIIDKLHDKLKDDFRNCFKSITTDNGSEFQDYANVEKGQRTIQYFARPYKSCDRATNENLNRGIRRIFQKKTKFNNVTDRQIKKVQDWMKNKPRKILGYYTPLEAIKRINPRFVQKILV